MRKTGNGYAFANPLLPLSDAERGLRVVVHGSEDPGRRRVERSTVVSEKIRARFDSKWTPEPNTGCFLWFAARDGLGYGRFGFGGKIRRAHCLAWEWANGRSAIGQVVRHSCDQPACVNPRHLLIGLQSDNVNDRVARGRSARGQRNGGRVLAKLTENDVREIRAITAERLHSIAKRYGVSRSLISHIKAGRSWGHVL